MFAHNSIQKITVHTLVWILLIAAGQSLALSNTTKTNFQMPFIKNQGQMNSEVQFYARTFGGTVFLTGDNKLVYSLPDFSNQEAAGVVFSEVFVNGQVSPAQGEGNSSTAMSVFKSNDSSQWKNGIPSYEFVAIEGVFPGIDVKLRAYGDNVEKLYYVEPNGNPANIQMTFEGGKSLAITEGGELALNTELGICTFTKPIAFQIIDGKKRNVEVAYELTETGYGFLLGDYDTAKTLVIDPLLASTFVGGNSSDEAYEPCIAIDSNGNVFFTGETFSSDFPMVSGAYDHNLNGSSDRLVAKYSSDLSTLLATTFIGGNYSERGCGICIDDQDNVILAGYTQSFNFPTTYGAFDRGINGGSDDAFVAKLDNDLSTLIASTFFGGNNSDGGGFPRIDVAIGLEGNIYIAGLTASSNLPTNAQSYSQTYSGNQDFFVAKFTPDLTTLLASTYLGGNTDEWRPSIQIDDQGDVFVSGTTRTGFPTTAGSFSPTFNGGNYDMVIAKLSGDLSTLMAATYLGSNGEDNLKGIRLDEQGNLYTAGLSTSNDYPTTSGAFDEYHNGSVDMVVSKLDNNLENLLASTFVGGIGNDNGEDVFLDNQGRVHVVGSTNSTNFPTTNDAYDRTYNGNAEGLDSAMFIFNSDLSELEYSTYFGSGAEKGKCIVVDNSGTTYISGITYSANYPTTPGCHDGSFGYGETDCFIARFGPEVTGVNSDLPMEAGVRLIGNFPNPLNPTTAISYSLSQDCNVVLSVYDLQGRLVTRLVNGPRSAGEHSEHWNGRNSEGVLVSSGVYSYRLQAGDYSENRKMNLLK